MLLASTFAGIGFGASGFSPSSPRVRFDSKLTIRGSFHAAQVTLECISLTD
jgi:hypothetical protein